MVAEPEVSVLINNFNYGAFLPRAIDTALAQQGVRAEVIVVDDGSTDDSAAIIRGYGDRIRPIFQQNGGQASAINAGVAAARAPVLTFLDADDWWAPDKLALVLKAMAAAPGAGLVYHRLQPVHSDGSVAFSAIPRSLCSGDLLPRLIRSGGRWPFPMTSSLAVRRSAWDAAGEIPAGFRISADAWLTGIIPLLTPVVALSQALGFYRIHDNNWYRAQDDREMLARRMRHWRATVEVSNRFLASHGRSERMSLSDHFAYQAAAARLGLPDAPGGWKLLLLGLGDQGEPSPLRRIRESLRAMMDLRQSLPDSVEELS